MSSLSPADFALHLPPPSHHPDEEEEDPPPPSSGDEDHDAPPPPGFDHDVDVRCEEIDHFFATEPIKHGWLDHNGRVPTTNPFLLYSLSLCQNPWSSRNLHHLSNPDQLSNGLENVYMNQQSMRKDAITFRPQNGDLIVCGVFRSGQTPMLQIVSSLLHHHYVEKNHILVHAQWIESNSNPFYLSQSNSSSRVLKTHLPLRNVFGGEVLPHLRLKTQFKVIVMLRDPNDIRLSWFRHVRRVYRKFNPTSNVVPGAEFFAGINLYANDPNKSALFHNDRDYEDFIFETVKDYETCPERMLLCFYEELLVNPFEFVSKVATFLHDRDSDKVDFELVDAICLSLTEDEDFPDGFFSVKHTRKGSSGQGSTSFSPKAILYNTDKWRTAQSKFVSPFASYEELVYHYSSIIKRKPPPPPPVDVESPLSRGPALSFGTPSRRKKTTITATLTERKDTLNEDRESHDFDDFSPSTTTQKKSSRYLLSRTLRAFSKDRTEDDAADGEDEEDLPPNLEEDDEDVEGIQKSMSNLFKKPSVILPDANTKKKKKTTLLNIRISSSSLDLSGESPSMLKERELKAREWKPPPPDPDDSDLDPL